MLCTKETIHKLPVAPLGAGWILLKFCCSIFKVPVRSNFPNFMFVQFSKVYVVVTYQAKQFFNPSTGSPFFLTVFLAILRPPLIGRVPTAQ